MAANIEQRFDPQLSFLPRLLIERAIASRGHAAEKTGHAFEAAALFADISGFTALTERLAADDDAGVERLTQLVNAHFAPLVNLVLEHGGDVVKFAGDALLSVFPATDDLAAATLRATACGLAFHEAMADTRSVTGESLTLRASVSAGGVASALVGGVLGRREMLIAGEPITQLGIVGGACEPGQVVMTAAAADAVRASVSGERLDSGAFRVDTLTREPPLAKASSLPDITDVRDDLLTFIPAAIRGAVESGHTGWLGQLRRLTVLFINLAELDHRTPVQTAHEIARELQTVLYRYEGSVNKISVDDKGATMLAALGLPPLAHADDPVRGVLAAIDARDALARMGLNGAVGVTTGRVFCCVVGSERRREYTVMGDVVNMSARLMQQASAHQGVLCDEATYHAAQRRIRFSEPLPLVVKGKSEPVTAYIPLGTARARTHSGSALIGRTSERALIDRAIRELASGVPSVMPIAFVGAPGTGKSRLLDYAISAAQSADVRVLVGSGDPIERGTPYHAWRPIVRTALGLDDEQKDRAERVYASLEGAPELAGLAPLLDDIVGLDLPDNEITKHLQGETRADRTRELISGIVRRLAELEPVLLILDDAHWLDSASWATCVEVHTFAPNVLFLVANRPLRREGPRDLADMLAHGTIQQCELGPLSGSDVSKLAGIQLGGETLADRLEQLFAERSQGNPFYVEELARTLSESGAVHVVEGRCELVGGAETIERLGLPATLEGLVTSRIDRLGNSEQLALKAASVIGRTFGLRTLHEVYPMRDERAGLAGVVASLVEAEITSPTDDANEPSHRFREGMVQDVAYKLLSGSQRRELHLAAAEAYERIYQGDLHTHYPVLAHHYARAEVKRRAAEYLGQAGELAYRSYANHEAVEFLGSALAESMAISVPIERHIRGRWERQLGDAHFALGNIAESRAHLTCALRTLGQPVTDHSFRLTLWTVGNLAANTLHRLSPFKRSPRRGVEAERILDTVRALERLTQIHFFAQEAIAGVHATTAAVRLAARIEESDEGARAFANACLMNSILGWGGAARRFENLAMQAQKSPPAEAYVKFVLAMHHAGHGRWDRARELFGRSVAIAEDMKDHRRFDESGAAFAVVLHHIGELDASIALYSRVYESGVRHGSAQAQLWGLLGQARNLVVQRDVEPALELLAKAQEVLRERRDIHDRLSEQEVHALLAAAHLQQGNGEGARTEAKATSAYLATTRPSAFYTAHLYSIPAMVAATLLREGAHQGSDDRRALIAEAKQAVRAARSFSRAFRIGRPQFLVCKAALQEALDKRGAARRTLIKATRAAEALNMSAEREAAERARARIDRPQLPSG